MLFLIMLLTGCLPQFNTVDDACVDDPNGTDKVTGPNAVKGINRINCHRRVAGVRHVGFKKGICEASLGHANYLSANWDDLPVRDSTEDTVYIGYSGRTLLERLEKNKFELEETEQMYEFILEFDDAEVNPPDEAIDLAMYDPRIREILLQPSVRALCYERDEHIGVIDVVYTWPPESHTGKPIFYPNDGQYEVPTTAIDWGFELNGVIPDDEDSLPLREPLGFPLTVMVTNDEGIVNGPSDAYGISIPRATLKQKGGGSVEMQVVVPVATPTTLDSTVMFLPEYPLDYRSEYTLDFKLLYGGGSGESKIEKDYAVTFHTLDTTDVSHPEFAPVIYGFGPIPQ